jgi:hypothetical protein
MAQDIINPFLIVIYMDYLLQFVIASCFFVYVWFYQFVNGAINTGKLNAIYFNYIIIMPIWFGILNMISLYFQKQFGLSYQTRFLVITFVGLAVLLPIINFLPFYNYNATEMAYHNTGVTIFYFFIWNVVIAGLEKLITHKKFDNSDILVMGGISMLYLLQLIFSQLSSS